ncbi:MAG: enolase C-terminal domain-like protein [Vicinamibacterales bacterium]
MAAASTRVATGPPIRAREAMLSALTIPAPEPESDGTLEWRATSVVVLELAAGGAHGLGHGWAPPAAARVVHDVLLGVVDGRDAFDVTGAWDAMARAVRNAGRPGIASMAIAVVDAALWDLKARLIGLPLAGLLGQARESVPAYGSGGFTSLSIDGLERQLGDWAASGLSMVKMKVGRDAAADPGRVAAARRAIGDEVALFVDANGGYTRKVALAQAEAFAGEDVTWFEEPVSSDDLEGLRLLRDRGPGGMAIAAGEYGFDLYDFRRMLDAGAVDVLQADATRCGGPTGFLRVAALCRAWGLPLSAHTAPSLHAPLGCAEPVVAHVEYFADHARIEPQIFDGALRPVRGRLRPDPARPGFGLTFKRVDAARFAA